jgi:arginase
LQPNIQKKNIVLLGAPTKLGQHLKGVDTTPKLLLEQLKIHEKIKSSKKFNQVHAEILDFAKHWNETPNKITKFEEQIAHRAHEVGVMNGVISSKMRSIDPQDFIVTIGGDHSIGFGTIHGALSRHPDALVIWVDAHADANTPLSSKSKSMHGMPVSAHLNWFDYKNHVKGFEWCTPLLTPQNLVYIGIRDLDPFEEQILGLLNIKSYTPRKNREKNWISNVMQEILIEHKGNSGPIHLSFDVVGIDPEFAPATGTIAPEGLTMKEAIHITDQLHKWGSLVSMDLVEINPFLNLGARAGSPVLIQTIQDIGEDIKTNKNSVKTVQLGINLIYSALGVK